MEGKLRDKRPTRLTFIWNRSSLALNQVRRYGCIKHAGFVVDIHIGFFP